MKTIGLLLVSIIFIGALAFLAYKVMKDLEK